MVLSDRQRLDWLRLIRSESVGPRTFRSLMNRYGGAAAALDALPDLARQAGRTIRICPQSEAEREIAALDRLGGRLLALGEGAYPPALQAIDTAPPLIAVLGRSDVLLRPCVAIVGSRNASAAGLKVTARLARDLGEAGFVVVSGLARGIDTAAHEASLGTGTVAVLAGGLDEVYPPQNIPLLQRLMAEGAAISEMPLGLAPRGRDFPRRNRLVSGLSLGTVVVEAARKSGSLITARFANEQGRIVFAVPGSPLDPRAEGGNHLIREGATLCAEAAHVVEALAPLVGREDALLRPPHAMRDGAGETPSQPLWDELDLPGIEPAPLARWPEPAAAAPDAGTGAEDGQAIRRRVLALLGAAPVSLDDLVRASGCSARDVSRTVLDLELGGAIRRHPGGALSRAED
ncbi:DNA-processing protein DprA [Bosea sp. (in: a-proteobacteria)]|uniref:DNA-processing protein DprA n=1 Tax=Bosea sp. (in: a-proteobacteria) TaxID=1871050 RepID=UPI0027331E52|nr:DNA-processing protein DprA [Bosea sp. (in: a-proteobacteria)]MDP3258514.1 DNA-processing protein DprA [Bosea sp. (in: a-proteobacteria)]